jgi:hypothetical protein
MQKSANFIVAQTFRILTCRNRSDEVLQDDNQTNFWHTVNVTDNLKPNFQSHQLYQISTSINSSPSEGNHHETEVQLCHILQQDNHQLFENSIITSL